MIRRAKLVVAGVGTVLLLSACSQTTADRSSGAGKKADLYLDATNVVVFNNADSVPNVALFCLGKFRFASTLSGSDTGENKGAVLVRLPEDDVACGGEPR